jgi:hypothetical protein
MQLLFELPDITESRTLDTVPGTASDVLAHYY